MTRQPHRDRRLRGRRTIPAAAVNGLGEGTHHVFVHSKDSLGLWGPPLDIPLHGRPDRPGASTPPASARTRPTGCSTDKGNPGYLVVSAQITDKDAGGAARAGGGRRGRSSTRRATPAGGTGLQLVAVDGKLDSLDRDGLRPDPASRRSRRWPTARTTSRPRPGRGRQLGRAVRGRPCVVDKTAPVLGAADRLAQPDQRGGRR